MNKKTGVRVLVLLVIAAAIAASAWWYAGHRDDEETSGIILYGNVDIREVDLSFNNSEHIDQILVQEGDRGSTYPGRLVVPSPDVLRSINLES